MSFPFGTESLGFPHFLTYRILCLTTYLRDTLDTRLGHARIHPFDSSQDGSTIRRF